MRKYLDLTSWILLFFFAPFTVLILLSQNSLPGDFFYPVKRGLENIILAGASVNPTTRVAFRTGLTQTRFIEAQKLLVSKADTTAFSDFITEVSSTQQDLSLLSSSKDKIENSDKLIAKIDEYQTQLSQVQNQVQIAQGLPTQGQGEFQQQPSQNQPAQPTVAPITQQPVQPSTPSQPIQTAQPVAQTPPPAIQTTAPTAIPTPPPLAPTVTNQIANNPQKAEEVKEKIKDTQENLEKIKEKIKKEKEDAQIQEKVREEQKKLNEELRKKEKNEPTANPANH